MTRLIHKSRDGTRKLEAARTAETLPTPRSEAAPHSTMACTARTALPLPVSGPISERPIPIRSPCPLFRLPISLFGSPVRALVTHYDARVIGFIVLETSNRVDPELMPETFRVSLASLLLGQLDLIREGNSTPIAIPSFHKNWNLLAASLA